MTGHRDLMTEEVLHIRAAVGILLSSYWINMDRQLQLLAPLAQGSDQPAFDIAHKLGFEAIDIFPMSLNTDRADFPGQERTVAHRSQKKRA